MSYYSQNSKALIEQYENIESEVLHSDWLPFLPKNPGLACDIGAGTGRDANWLAAKGWSVYAVEPEHAFRKKIRESCHPRVVCINDRIPNLSRLRKLNQSFDLILLSAVWMHISESVRERAFRILSNLLKPGGRLVISLRHSSSEDEMRERGHFHVSLDELERYAKNQALIPISITSPLDMLGREHVKWKTLVLEIPDDGTGNLPLLRQIIVNDNKSASNKLGLLRALLRIADGASGMVIRQTDDYVEIPFGLVGLYWIKLYLPLVLQRHLILSPSHNPKERKGLGFAKKAHFYRLIEEVSPYDLRVGATFGQAMARLVVGSIRDACANIRDMPAKYITYPSQDKQIFECEKRPDGYQIGKAWHINKETLSAFGVFRIPLLLWQCLGQHACWIEPAILNEWANLMNGYNIQYNQSVYDGVFQWEGAKRETQQVRRIAEMVQQKLIASRQKLLCTWSGKKLVSDHFDIDHCFPWSRWFNNDLWNLLPTNKKVNIQKSDKLPSASLMNDSKARILAWWEEAYDESVLRRQFMTEAESSLPLVCDASNFTEVFDAVLCQRVRLREDQRLEEWGI